MAIQRRAQRRKYHIIYKTTCLITNKWYIGLHSTDDLNDGYQGSGTHLWRSIQKYGKAQHKTEILEHCADRESLAQREAEIVNEDLLAQVGCMNLMIGGNANVEEVKTTTEDSKRKNSEASKRMWAKRREEGWVAPPQKSEHVAKRAKANTGKKRTAIQLANLQEGQARYYASADPLEIQVRAQKAAVTRQERGTNRGGRPAGIAMPEEQKQHLSTITTGKVWPRATCLGCGKETTLGALNRYHAMCRAADASTNRS